jgi:REP element-mobilizing transposase RayT
MSRRRKCFIPKTVVEIGGSVEDGLPFSPTNYMAVLIWGVLAAASTKYSVTVCGLVVMRNHFHMIIVVQDARSVPSFVQYFKQELAHYVNRLLGRKKHTVWESRYFSPTILDASKVFQRLRYMYANPCKAGLADRIENFKGVNTFSCMVRGGLKKTFKRIPRSAVPALPESPLTLNEQKILAKSFLDNEEAESFTLEIDPWAWTKCFEETKYLDEQDLLKTFLPMLRECEAGHRANRTKRPLSAEVQILTDPRTSYDSERDGKKIVCFASAAEIRIPFINWFKEQSELARECFQRWKTGDTSPKPPPGFFAPGGFLYANIYSR